MKNKGWYKFYWGECPVCGNDASYKIFIKDSPKPKEYKDRWFTISQMEAYDDCDF